MDGIQPFAGPHRPAPYGQPAPGLHGFGPQPSHSVAHALPAKTPGDYLRAVRRRAWLVLAVAALVSVSGTLLVLRMPAIYRATAEIMIEPPRYDQHLSADHPGRRAGADEHGGGGEVRPR